MTARRRKAKYLATLIYLDEPQLIAMQAKKTHVIAVAVPSDSGQAKFLATTVSDRDWIRYFDGNVDLRWLFTFPLQRTLYTFDSMEMKDSEVMLDPVVGDVDPIYLPEPRLFSEHHTHDYMPLPRAADEETLIIDGEWDIPELGDFHSSFSHVYAFAAAATKFIDPASTTGDKKKLQDIFQDKPYKGGSSYVHFYGGLVSRLDRTQRLGLEKITYASPGEVKMTGDGQLLLEVRQLVESYLANRPAVQSAYGGLHKYLSKNRFLRMNVADFTDNNPHNKAISNLTSTLCESFGFGDYATVSALTGGNALVNAKLVLSLQRRLATVAGYFAEGRMNFTNPESPEDGQPIAG